nr:MAG TPA_asm: hypothetical protein [Caudoviricetes sp.]
MQIYGHTAFLARISAWLDSLRESSRVRQEVDYYMKFRDFLLKPSQMMHYLNI